MNNSKRGLSNSLLNGLFRTVVLLVYNGKCFFCGKTQDLEAHHICKRKHLTTRWDWRNGIAVCKFKCHEYASSKEGEDGIRKYIGEDLYFELDRLSRTTIKEHCFAEGITVNEFKRQKKAELIEKISELNLDA